MTPPGRLSASDISHICQFVGGVMTPPYREVVSMLTKEEFQTAIHNGIRKINYYTYMSLAGGKAVKEAMDKVKVGDNVFYHDIPLIGIKAMKEDIKNAIQIFSLEV